jgi:hypothetical protein
MDVVMIAGLLTQVSLVRENPKTVWVRAPGGKLIKRHKRKHSWLPGGF